MKSRSLRRRQSGFTLIELLVVIIILAILAAVVVPRVIGHTEDARESSVISNIKSFADALDVYKLDTHDYPTSEQGLSALITNPNVPGWNGPYLKNMTSIPLDPWGHPYIYKMPGDQGRDYDIISNGPDTGPHQGKPFVSWDLSQ